MARNLNFEVAGLVSGDAIGWRSERVAPDYSYAEFGAPPFASTHETFSSEWADGPTPTFTRATFNASTVPSFVETFERDWLMNHTSIPDLESMSVTSADFSGEPTETFEQGWNDNENSIPDLPSMPVTDATFNTPTSTTEAFDRQWRTEGDNERVLPFGHPAAISVNVTFSAPRTITIFSGDFRDDWDIRAGSALNIEFSTSNDGDYTIADVTPSTITLVSTDTVVNEGPIIVDMRNYTTREFEVPPATPEEKFDDPGWPDIGDF